MYRAVLSFFKAIYLFFLSHIGIVLIKRLMLLIIIAYVNLLSIRNVSKIRLNPLDLHELLR